MIPSETWTRRWRDWRFAGSDGSHGSFLPRGRFATTFLRQDESHKALDVRKLSGWRLLAGLKGCFLFDGQNPFQNPEEFRWYMFKWRLLSHLKVTTPPWIPWNSRKRWKSLKIGPTNTPKEGDHLPKHYFKLFRGYDGLVSRSVSGWFWGYVWKIACFAWKVSNKRWSVSGTQCHSSSSLTQTG